LSNQSVTDFLIIEYRDEIGGRMIHTTFGENPETSDPYTIELGANWVQGLGSEGGPENPIWTFAKEYEIVNEYSDYSSIATFNETGAVNYTDLLDEFEEAWTIFEQEAGYYLTENLQDKSMRAGIWQAGWNAKKDMMKQAVEWWMWGE
jgi:polyamine oxidase